MVSFLLATLFALQQIDYSPSIFYLDGRLQSQLAEQMMASEYQGPFRVYRSIPPIRKSDFVYPIDSISATAGIALDSMSRQVLWQKNTDQQMPIASLTKLMTALVFLETDTEFSEQITIAQEDNSNVEGSRLYVTEGETVTVGDLFYASLVGSANNATKALARSTGIPEEEFIRRMNDTAKRLGLHKTVFYDVTGLDPRNQSTVLEYSRIVQLALRNSTIRGALLRNEYAFETVDKHISHHIKNTDKLLGDDDLHLIGAKTGYLNEAGFTFACQAEDDGHGVIVVLFNSSSSEQRFYEAKILLQWAFSNYLWFTI